MGGIPFPKGHIPWNKGKKGLQKANRTSFKKGEFKGENNPMHGTVCYWRGQELSLKHRQAISNGLKKYKRTPEHSKNLSIAQKNKPSDSPSTRYKKSFARSQRKFPMKDTKIELLLKQHLEKQNIIFKQHVSFPIGRKHHQVDFLINNKIVIECDGCWWHCCTKCYNEERFNKQIYPWRLWWDPLIKQTLEDNGLIVLRFWEHELKDDIESCIQRIKGVMS